MKHKIKFVKGTTVIFVGKLYKIESYKLSGLTGIEYNLESMLPDKKGFFERCYNIWHG